MVTASRLPQIIHQAEGDDSSYGYMEIDTATAILVAEFAKAPPPARG